MMERMSLDNKEEEEEEELVFSTPPSSPVKENVKKQVPRSLARSTSKKATRQVQNLKVRVAELKGCDLSTSCSFLTHTWCFEFGDTGAVLKSNPPKQNVQVMLNRVKLVHRLFQDNFASVSKVYIGKTTNSRSRFNGHQRYKKKDGCMLVMIAVEVFVPEDVPDEDNERWGMTAETVALHYERLLTLELMKEGMVYEDSEESGGGGRCANEGNIRETTVYMLLSVSNNV